MTAPARLLLTGASGFAAGHLLPALRAAFPGAALHAASRRGPVAGADATHALDLLDGDGLRAAVAAIRPDAVVHLAAQAAVAASFDDPGRTWRINLLGTLALAEAVRAEAPGAVFVLASSAEAYGLSFRAGVPLAEDAPFAPANPYAASKAAVDLAVGEMALRGLRAVRLRPFNHTGPGQGEGFVVAAFARQVARIEAGLQEPVLRVGALDRWRDFLDVADVCRGYVAAVARSGALPPGVAINLASGAPRRVGDILDALLDLAGLRGRVAVEEEASRLRPTDVERTAGDASRARDLLDWRPEVPFARTLEAVLDDWRRRVRAA